jgi:hypothetical protein
MQRSANGHFEIGLCSDLQTDILLAPSHVEHQHAEHTTDKRRAARSKAVEPGSHRKRAWPA